MEPPREVHREREGVRNDVFEPRLARREARRALAARLEGRARRFPPAGARTSRREMSVESSAPWNFSQHAVVLRGQAQHRRSIVEPSTFVPTLPQHRRSIVEPSSCPGTNTGVRSSSRRPSCPRGHNTGVRSSSRRPSCPRGHNTGVRSSSLLKLPRFRGHPTTLGGDRDGEGQVHPQEIPS
jgi:hypothetical protein